MPFFSSFSSLEEVIGLGLGLIVAITVHEAAHALVADRLGDPTPRLQGRLTLNPLSHLDPLGTLMLILVRFGWGRPVQFDPYNLRDPQKDSALISLAGPIANLITAGIIALLLRTTVLPLSDQLDLLLMPLLLIALININLAVFNLIPIPPLDGAKFVAGVLPRQLAPLMYSLEQYGFFILIAVLILFPGFLAATILPLSRTIQTLFFGFPMI